MKKFSNYWLSLDEETVINRKLLLFEILTALFAGIVLGFIFAPFKSLTIASNNENNGNGNSASAEKEEKAD